MIFSPFLWLVLGTIFSILGASTVAVAAPPVIFDKPLSVGIFETSPLFGSMSTDCTLGDGTDASGGGAGIEGKVVVCPHEDWWLPSSVERSDSGNVIAGYGYPADCWENSRVSMVGHQSYWESIESAGAGSVDAGVGTLLNNYGRAVGHDYEKKLYLSVFEGSDEGSQAPQYLADAVPSMESAFVADPFYDPTDSVQSGWIGQWRDDGSTYVPWNEDFLAARKDFLSSWGAYLASHPYGYLVEQMNLNSENCLAWSYLAEGYLDGAELDGLAEGLFDAAINADVPIDNDKWLANVCVGGRAYKRYAELAAANGTGLGSHGAPLFFRHKFQHLFENTYYDGELKAYRQTGTNPYAFIHTDAEMLHHTDNTWGQYRMFRNVTSAVLALGVNRLLVTSSTLPSQGDYLTSSDPDGVNGQYDDNAGCYLGRSDEKIYNWDWAEIQDEGAAEYLEWMNKIIGLPARESPEAYCSLIQTGVAMPDGSDFDAEVSAYLAQDDWGQGPGDPSWPTYLTTPLLTYFGRHCDLDQTVEGGQGTPVLRLDEDRLRGDTYPSPVGGAFGQSADGTSLFYEGKATDSPADALVDDDPLPFEISLEEDGDISVTSKYDYSLYFKLEDEFVERITLSPSVKPAKGRFAGPAGPIPLRRAPATDFAVKVFFENHKGGAGAWRLEYDGKSGWTQGPKVTFDEDDSGILTATFHLTDAMFSNGGPGDSDLAIRTLSGDSAAFLHLRVIKIEK